MHHGLLTSAPGEDCYTPTMNTQLSLPTLSALRTCAKVKDLSLGTRLHGDILRRGLLHKFSDALVNMYARYGALDKAKEVFDLCKIRNIFTWTSLIAGFVEKGRAIDALVYYERMQHEGISPIAVTFTCILKACCSVGAVDKGEQIHDEIAKQGLLQINPMLGNALVNMYAKCGALKKAKQVLEDLPTRNVNTWCALITGYSHEGKGEQALDSFERMQHEGLSPDPITFTCILKACGSTGAMNKGEQIHNEILEQNLLENNVELGTALVDMYVKCGALEKARDVLKELPVRNVISWSALIAAAGMKNEEEIIDLLRIGHEEAWERRHTRNKTFLSQKTKYQMKFSFWEQPVNGSQVQSNGSNQQGEQHIQSYGNGTLDTFTVNFTKYLWKSTYLSNYSWYPKSACGIPKEKLCVRIEGRGNSHTCTTATANEHGKFLCDLRVLGHLVNLVVEFIAWFNELEVQLLVLAQLPLHR
ncbi:hypothetical protein L7F22_034256 [Adiantum nelumboides]|nr:hypothetical protein [Adiantum nelumboides]